MQDPDLTARVAALEEAMARLRDKEAPARADPCIDGDAGGFVRFAGSLDLPGPARVEWRMSHPSQGLLACDWTEIAPALAALGHPVRLNLLQAVLNGTRETAALAETLGEGTTGQLHHHLRELTATGWLRSERRGRYSVPADRVVPLLVAVAAAGGSQTGQASP